MSRYRLLAIEDFPDASAPGTPAPPEGGPSHAPSQAGTRAPSPTPRAPSPTPRLQPFVFPSEYVIDNVAYQTIDEAIRGSAVARGIQESIANWMIGCITGIIHTEMGQIYNVLGNKIYEHRDLQDTMEGKVKRAVRGLRDAISGCGEEIERLQGVTANLPENQKEVRADLEVLNANHQTLLHEFRNLHQAVKALPSSSAPSFTPPAPAQSSAPRPKIAEPPKFKGTVKGDLSLEQWLQRFGIWARYQGITSDETRIVTALMFLDGGAAQFMDDYARRAAAGLPLGSWLDFESQLQMAYRDIAPEKAAQAELDEICNKRQPSVAHFAEAFRRVAPRTKYADTELIRRIDLQTPANIRQVQVTIKITDLQKVPTMWARYLDWVLGLEMDLRGNKDRPQASSSSIRAPADPNAMEVDALKKPQKMSKEQVEWLEKKLCFRCGKHPYKKGQTCRNPKYKGFYELPDSTKMSPCTTTSTSRVRTLAEEREEFLRAQAEKFDREHSQTPTPPPATAPAPTTGATISTLESDDAIADFLSGM